MNQKDVKSKNHKEKAKRKVIHFVRKCRLHVYFSLLRKKLPVNSKGIF